MKYAFRSWKELKDQWASAAHHHLWPCSDWPPSPRPPELVEIAVAALPQHAAPRPELTTRLSIARSTQTTTRTTRDYWELLRATAAKNAWTTTKWHSCFTTICQLVLLHLPTGSLHQALVFIKLLLSFCLPPLGDLSAPSAGMAKHTKEQQAPTA